MRCYSKKVRDNYKSILERARTSELILPQASIQLLLVVAIILSVIAMLGYSIGGYQFAFLEINSFSSNISPALLSNLTIFGDGVFLLALVLLFSCRNVRFLWTVLFTTIVAAIVVNLLKDYFAIPRPPAVLDPESFNLLGRAYKARSFPSGHSMTAFLLASICFCYIQNWYFKVSILILAVLVGLSRVLIGVHWPMDVLIGGALGVVLGVAGVIVTVKWKAGICAFVHLFTLTVLVIACIMVFVDGNDYKLALPLIYASAGAALAQVIRDYFLVK